MFLATNVSAISRDSVTAVSRESGEAGGGNRFVDLSASLTPSGRSSVSHDLCPNALFASASAAALAFGPLGETFEK